MSGDIESFGGRDEAAQAIALFARTIEELRMRSTEIDQLRRREKERADALAVTSETLVRSHPGGLVVIDASGRLADANEPARAMLELPPSAVGRPADAGLSAFPELREAVAKARRGVATLAEEFSTGDTAAGRRLAVTAVPVTGAAGSLLGTFVFLEDRTVTSRLTRELSAGRELAALGEMSAGIAHEFRNATATILGYTRLAGLAEDAATRSRHLQAVKSEAEHVARVTGDFLFFARPERLSTVPSDLGRLAEETVAEERVASPTVSILVRGEFGVAPVDAALIRRALINLLRNAREAACADGAAGHVLVRGEGVTDRMIRVAVEDDGPGVPSDALPKLFVPFFSTKESGTGIGLALVAKIAALHGGTITVERSAELGGARFVLSLPAKREN
jgi:signal transduction histidine kinase